MENLLIILNAAADTKKINVPLVTSLLIIGAIFLVAALVMYLIFAINKKGCKDSAKLLEKLKIRTQKNPDSVVDLINIVMLAVGVLGLLLILIASILG